MPVDTASNHITMAFKAVLIVASIAQLLAAILALRINLRYRIYSAWFLLSASACVGAILQLTRLSEVWNEAPSVFGNSPMWLSELAALLGSIFLLAGMALVEPFFIRISQAEQLLRREHSQLTSRFKETEEELRLAQRIQRRLLPSSSPQLQGVDVHGESMAAEWTSGDYFDYLSLRSGEVAVVIADVCGHGLGPALLMSSTRASLRGLAPTISDVGELLTYGNRAVVDSVSEREFVTAFAVRYDAANRVLHHVGAGHVAYMLRQDGKSTQLLADGPPLGIMPDLTLKPSRSPVEPGEILILLTDGILESRNGLGEMFGEARLLKTVEMLREKSAQEIVRELIKSAISFAADQPQQDDITVVVMKFE